VMLHATLEHPSSSDVHTPFPCGISSYLFVIPQATESIQLLGSIRNHTMQIQIALLLDFLPLCRHSREGKTQLHSIFQAFLVQWRKKGEEKQHRLMLICTDCRN